MNEHRTVSADKMMIGAKGPVWQDKQTALSDFIRMRNSANDAKRVWLETFHVKNRADDIAMD